eukprot:TRINITY_DN319_c1_g1_i1.p1 TRINITY_DN319_c1_g1~~TRINITY_DN319_c1_g1_i1.p1  ORF type:complete len:130 (+),score=17.36 TRINITY_DN319_c1_g1_i1:209-598(+)
MDEKNFETCCDCLGYWKCQKPYVDCCLSDAFLQYAVIGMACCWVPTILYCFEILLFGNVYHRDEFEFVSAEEINDDGSLFLLNAPVMLGVFNAILCCFPCHICCCCWICAGYFRYDRGYNPSLTYLFDD